jgi:hypothetical protein
MKRYFPVLAVLLGLGSVISSAQTARPVKNSDPFERYLASVKKQTPEDSLRRFAGECGVNTNRVQPKFAVSPGGSWTAVKNLAAGLRSLETDFYTTAQLWKDADRVLVVLWPNSDADGSEIRQYRCYVSGKLTQAKVIQWEIPMDPDYKGKTWGYARTWKCDAGGKLKQIKAGFVNGLEQTIIRPKLSAEEEKNLNWTVNQRSLTDLKFPARMLTP